MSFAKIVKEELTKIQETKEVSLAELSAMIDLGTEFAISGGQKTLWFKSNNTNVARRFLSLLKQLYKVDNTLLTKQQGNFNKGTQIQLGITESLEEIISEHGILSDTDDKDLLLQTQEAKCSYLRGAFLTSGSVNDPKTAEYHLEIYAENKNAILRIQRLMNDLTLNAKITTRRKGLICYLKDATSIEDFLRHIGGSSTVFEYEDIRIKRDFNNSINRVLNCEIANEKKTIMAANQQLLDIEIVEQYYSDLNIKLKQAIEVRKDNPDVSLTELVDLFEDKYKESITKSGLNHRFKKIKELAEDAKRGNL